MLKICSLCKRNPVLAVVTLMLRRVVEGNAPWLQEQLRAAIPRFPAGMLEYVGSYQRATYGQAILPTFYRNGSPFALSICETF